MSAAEKILAEALQLSEEDRERVARELVISLDVGQDDDVEAAWAREIDARVRGIVDGSVEMVDGEEAERMLRARLARARTR